MPPFPRSSPKLRALCDVIHKIGDYRCHFYLRSVPIRAALEAGELQIESAHLFHLQIRSKIYRSTNILLIHKIIHDHVLIVHKLHQIFVHRHDRHLTRSPTTQLHKHLMSLLQSQLCVRSDAIISLISWDTYIGNVPSISGFFYLLVLVSNILWVSVHGSVYVTGSWSVLVLLYSGKISSRKESLRGVSPQITL